MTLAKYNEIMSKIEVTDEMQSRILKNVENHFADKKSSHKKLWYPVFGGVAAAAMLMLIIRPWEGSNSPVGQNPPITGNQPPIMEQGGFGEEYSSVEELSKAVGFDMFELNNLPFEAKETNYTAIDKDFAEINYSGEENSLTYRKSVGTEDNSGDYNVYDYSGEIEINKIKVAVKGEAELLKLASWTDGKYSYSIALDKAVTQKAMTDMVIEVIEKEKSGS